MKKYTSASIAYDRLSKEDFLKWMNANFTKNTSAEEKRLAREEKANNKKNATSFKPEDKRTSVEKYITRFGEEDSKGYSVRTEQQAQEADRRH